MKRLLVVLGLLGAVTMSAVGCGDQTAHDRYRSRIYRRSRDANRLGMRDDIDAVFLMERPTHLSPWVHQ
jgi:hypothetical protein